MTATRRLDHAALGEILRMQYGVIARKQTVACGLTDRALRHRLRPVGSWRTMLPGVYLTQTGTPTQDQQDMAALLYAGTGSVLTGYSSLRRFGLRTVRRDEVDVLVPAKRERRSTGFVRILHTYRMPDQFVVSGPMRIAIVARAVADTARTLNDLRKVRALVADSVQRGCCEIAELMKELNEGPVVGSALLRRALAEVIEGVRSTAEADLLDLVKHGRLPMPMFNARLVIGEKLIAVVDAWWPGARVVVEVDSREWHLSPEDWQRTLRRHARLSAHGIVVLHFTPRQIRTERAQVIETIRGALAAARAEGQPAVRALPAAV